MVKRKRVYAPRRSKRRRKGGRYYVGKRRNTSLYKLIKRNVLRMSETKVAVQHLRPFATVGVSPAAIGPAFPPLGDDYESRDGDKIHVNGLTFFGEVIRTDGPAIANRAIENIRLWIVEDPKDTLDTSWFPGYLYTNSAPLANARYGGIMTQQESLDMAKPMMLHQGIKILKSKQWTLSPTAIQTLQTGTTINFPEKMGRSRAQFTFYVPINKTFDYESLAGGSGNLPYQLVYAANGGGAISFNLFCRVSFKDL